MVAHGTAGGTIAAEVVGGAGVTQRCCQAVLVVEAVTQVALGVHGPEPEEDTHRLLEGPTRYKAQTDENKLPYLWHILDETWLNCHE